jgi:hypothetical protein
MAAGPMAERDCRMRSNLWDIFVECGRLEGHALWTLMQEPLTKAISANGIAWWSLVGACLKQPESAML